MQIVSVLSPHVRRVFRRRDGAKTVQTTVQAQQVELLDGIDGAFVRRRVEKR